MTRVARAAEEKQHCKLHTALSARALASPPASSLPPPSPLNNLPKSTTHRAHQQALKGIKDQLAAFVECVDAAFSQTGVSERTQIWLQVGAAGATSPAPSHCRCRFVYLAVHLLSPHLLRTSAFPQRYKARLHHPFHALPIRCCLSHFCFNPDPSARRLGSWRCTSPFLWWQRPWGSQTRG